MVSNPRYACRYSSRVDSSIRVIYQNNVMLRAEKDRMWWLRNHNILLQGVGLYRRYCATIISVLYVLSLEGVYWLVFIFLFSLLCFYLLFFLLFCSVSPKGRAGAGSLCETACRGERPYMLSTESETCVQCRRYVAVTSTHSNAPMHAPTSHRPYGLK